MNGVQPAAPLSIFPPDGSTINTWLPKNVISRILGLLNNQNRAAAAQVCRLWKDITSDKEFFKLSLIMHNRLSSYLLVDHQKLWKFLNAPCIQLDELPCKLFQKALYIDLAFHKHTLLLNYSIQDLLAKFSYHNIVYISSTELITAVCIDCADGPWTLYHYRNGQISSYTGEVLITPGMSILKPFRRQNETFVLPVFKNNKIIDYANRQEVLFDFGVPATTDRFFLFSSRDPYSNTVTVAFRRHTESSFKFIHLGENSALLPFSLECPLPSSFIFQRSAENVWIYSTDAKTIQINSTHVVTVASAENMRALHFLDKNLFCAILDTELHVYSTEGVFISSRTFPGYICAIERDHPYRVYLSTKKPHSLPAIN